MSLLPLLRCPLLVPTGSPAARHDRHRLFSAVEGRPGLAVDRYDVLLAQTFRAMEPTSRGTRRCRTCGSTIWSGTGGGPGSNQSRCLRRPSRPNRSRGGHDVFLCGTAPGAGPWLFLDFRVGRRAARCRARQVRAQPLPRRTGWRAFEHERPSMWIAASNLDVADNAVRTTCTTGGELEGGDPHHPPGRRAARQGESAAALRGDPHTPSTSWSSSADLCQEPLGALIRFGTTRPCSASALQPRPVGVVLATNHVSTVGGTPGSPPGVRRRR